jgi:predicted DNA-binding transcriptional regulator YafY
MSEILNIFEELLLEQDAKLLLLRNAISERTPITIDYRSEDDEVLNGVRYDIEPVVLGTHAKSGNLVFWAYVFKGTSKKGLPGWKMFRVDRVNQIKTKPGLNPFKLTDLPGYQKGKAPNAMKSLSKVEIFSPYWFEDDARFKKDQPTQPAPPKPKTTAPTPAQPSPQPQPKPTPEPEKVEPQDIPTSEPQKNYGPEVLNNLRGKVKDIEGQKVVNKQDYETAVKDLYNRKEGDWKNYQRQVAGNDRPGEGTRARFDKESRTELDTLLNKDNIKVQDENQPENLSETIKRIKTLINSLV